MASLSRTLEQLDIFAGVEMPVYVPGALLHVMADLLPSMPLVDRPALQPLIALMAYADELATDARLLYHRPFVVTRAVASHLAIYLRTLLLYVEGRDSVVILESLRLLDAQTLAGDSRLWSRLTAGRVIMTDGGCYA